MIYLGADHRGYKLKEHLLSFLKERGYQVSDKGAKTEESSDYPLIAETVAREVIKDPNNRGVLLCGSGIGVCMVANKIKGVLAGLAWNEQTAVSGRNDDDINVLCLPADYIDEDQAEKIVQSFLDTSFEGVERRKRRLEQIRQLEK